MFGVIFLLLFPLLAQGEVISFTNCNQFFVNRASPTILSDATRNNRYRQICQCLLDQNDRKIYYYATLYDTIYKIPVYSAYQFHHATVVRKDPWYIEPQLDGGQRACMGGVSFIPENQRGVHQALNEDFVKCGCHRGHLYPVYHTSTQKAMEATSTLTNAAPQCGRFNAGRWRVHEENLAKTLQRSCNGPSFIVTGVVAGNTKVGCDVRVAKYFWSAYCCINTRQSGASIGPDQNDRVVDLSVTDLETRLSNSNHYNQPFSVFPGIC